MKFQKTLVAVAIAGIAAAPMVASADTTLSGAVQVQFQGTDADDVPASDAVEDDPLTPDVDETAAAVAASSPGELTIGAGDVLFGIVSEHELNSGLTGYGSLRVDLDRLSNAGSVTVDPGTPGNDEDDTAIASAGSADSVYVGIKGGFGDVRFGEIPNAVEYGQVANDIFDVTGEVNGGLSYTGTFGPVGLIGNFSPEANSDMVGVGAKFSLGGFSIGLGAEDKAENQNIAAGVSFAFAGASIAAHYWSQENGDAPLDAVEAVAAVGDTPAVAAVDAALAGDQESVSVKVGYGFGGVSASVTYSILEGQRANRGSDKEAIRLDAVYDLGGSMDISTRITSETNNLADTDLVSWRIKLSKAF